MAINPTTRAPISPDKAPRNLQVIPKIRHDTLNKSVRRALFTESAIREYHELYQRDLSLADGNPHQWGAYYKRAHEYADQLFSCQKMKKKLKSEIRLSLKNDGVVQNPNSRLPANP